MRLIYFENRFCFAHKNVSWVNHWVSIWKHLILKVTVYQRVCFVFCLIAFGVARLSVWFSMSFSLFLSECLTLLCLGAGNTGPCSAAEPLSRCIRGWTSSPAHSKSAREQNRDNRHLLAVQWSWKLSTEREASTWHAITVTLSTKGPNCCSWIWK